MPGNVAWRWHGSTVQIPLVGFLGLIGVLFTLVEVVLTHAIGRIAGPAWIIACFLYYIAYRRSRGLPIAGSINHHWETQQRAILKDAEEHDLLEQYEFALAQRDRRLAKEQSRG